MGSHSRFEHPAADHTLATFRPLSKACLPALLDCAQEEWDEEQHPARFELRGTLPSAQAEQPAAPEPVQPAVPARAPAAGKAAVRETEEGIVLLSSDDEGPATEPAAAPGAHCAAACGHGKAARGRACAEPACGEPRTAWPAHAGKGKRKAAGGEGEDAQGKRARVEPAVEEDDVVDLLDSD